MPSVNQPRLQPFHHAAHAAGPVVAFDERLVAGDDLGNVLEQLRNPIRIKKESLLCSGSVDEKFDRARAATPVHAYRPYASNPTFLRPINGKSLKKLGTPAPSPSLASLSNSRSNKPHRDAAAFSSVTPGASGTSALGTTVAANALSTTSAGILDARCI